MPPDDNDRFRAFEAVLVEWLIRFSSLKKRTQGALSLLGRPANSRMGAGGSAGHASPAKAACKAIQADRALWTTLDSLLESGGASLGELRVALAPFETGTLDVEQVFRAMDREGTGLITREGFMATMREVNAAMPRCFRVCLHTPHSRPTYRRTCRSSTPTRVATRNP